MPAAVIYPLDQSSTSFRQLEEAFAKEYDSRAKLLTERWARYRGDWPDPLKLQQDKVQDNVILALVDQVADKCVTFLLGDGIEFDAGDEADTADADVDEDEADTALADAWRANRGQLLQHQIALSGAIAGHCAVRIEPAEPGSQYPRLVLLNPGQFSAFWQADDIQKVLWYRVQYRLTRDGEGKRVDYVSDLALGGTDRDAWYEYVYSIAPVSSRWDLVSTQPLDYCPIVDWQNLPQPFEYYGLDDVSGAIRLNSALNLAASNMSRILKHYASPKTVGIGFEADQVVATEVGGLFTVSKPRNEADVFNLEMQTDLASTQQWIALLERQIWQSARQLDPQTFKDKIGQLTNFGLKVLYTDAVQKTDTKRLLYGEAFEKIGKLVLSLMGEAVPERITTLWPDPLPQDNAALSQSVLAEVGGGLIDKQTAREKLGYDNEQVEARLEEEAAEQDDIGTRLLTAFEQGRGAVRAPASASPPPARPGTSPTGTARRGIAR